MNLCDKPEAEFGPEAVFTWLGNILIVHLDHPSDSTIQSRIAEVQREADEPADCPLCEFERVRGGYTVVYDGGSVWQYNETGPGSLN